MSKITEKDSKLISAFLDGELDTQQVNSQDANILRTRLEQGDKLLKEELENFTRVRDAYKNWFSDQNDSLKNVNIFAAIEGKLEKQNRLYSSSWLGKIRAHFEEMFDIRVAVASFASVTVVIFAWSFFVSETLQQASVNAPEMVSSNFAENSRLENLPSENILVQVSLDNDLKKSGNKLQLKVPLSSVIDNPTIGQSLRASGLDIDWIKTDKSFEIMRPASKNVPPVIWVAYNGNK